MARTGRDRERLRDERELREAARVLAHLRRLTREDAAQALKDHAALVETSVIEVAREVLAHRPVIRPRVLLRGGRWLFPGGAVRCGADRPDACRGS